MKIHVLSDLHTELSRPLIPETDADIVVLAGDIGNGTAGLDWALREPAFAGKPIVYVFGNHEFYDDEMQAVTRRCKEFAAKHGDGRLRILDNNELILDGVRILGSTLWTDFRLFGEDPDTLDGCLAAAKSYVMDFRVIRDGTGLLTPAATIAMHEEALGWLNERLAAPFDGPTVVVTHHAPHKGSLETRWANAPASAAFVSDLAGKGVFGRAGLWIHGHTHCSFDYRVAEGGGVTRVVCNPRGNQLARQPSPENGAFDGGLVINVPPQH